jgi:digeranylgeranylglycerophospholipid reductase
MRDECDVLVVGLGPAGAAAAAAAARGGLRVVAIERKTQPGHAAFENENEPRQGWIGAGWLKGESAGEGTFVDRHSFDQSLMEIARESGSEIRLGTTLTGLRTDLDVAQLRHSGESSELHYRFLIAADGPQSGISDSIGLPPLDVLVTHQYAVMLSQPRDHIDVFVSSSHAGAHAWLIPHGPDQASVGLARQNGSPAECRQVLDQLHMHLQLSGQIGSGIMRQVGGLIPAGGLRQRLVENRILFAGDAAGLTHPITGLGVPSAVISGETAGEICAAAHVGNIELGEYERFIRARFGPALERAMTLRQRLQRAWADDELHPQTGHWHTIAELPL